MKIKVEYSESIQISEGLWRKIGIEMESDDALVFADPDTLHREAKEYVQKWHQEGGVGSGQLAVTNQSAPPIIQVEKESYDKRVNTMLEDIKNCTTVEELLTYRHVAAANVYASAGYNTRMKELTEKTS